MKTGDKGWLVVSKCDHEFSYSLHRTRPGARAAAMAILKDYRNRYTGLRKLSDLADFSGGDSYIEIESVTVER